MIESLGNHPRFYAVDAATSVADVMTSGAFQHLKHKYGRAGELPGDYKLTVPTLLGSKNFHYEGAKMPIEFGAIVLKRYVLGSISETRWQY